MSSTLRVLSLFSGIGGIDLGLERAGMEIIAHSENDPFASDVLAEHWPHVPNLGDVSELEYDSRGDSLWVSADEELVWHTHHPNVIAAGFPCQDISNQGAQGGIHGKHSGLWRYVVHAIRHIRPHYVILENVAAITSSNGGYDHGVVQGDLAGLGYDTSWARLSSGAFGAPHQRDRWWCIAHPQRERPPGPWRRIKPGDTTPHAYREAGDAVDAVRRDAVPFVCGRHDGVPSGVARRMLRALGNAVDPQVAEYVGRCVVADHEREVNHD